MANAKKIKTASSAGLSRPDVTVGPADPVRARIARKAIGTGGFDSRNREAGMLVDTSQVSAPYSTGYKLEAYRSSYAYGLSDRTGAYDIPTYFVQMNEQNGGMLYWPVTLHEKYSWYRYWARCFTNPNVLITKADGTEAPLWSFKPGDLVINAKGQNTEIEQVTTQHYEGAVIRFDVEANRWNDLEVTPEHPFLVLRSEHICRHHNRVKDENGKEHRQTSVDVDFAPEWLEAKDIREGDCLIVPKTQNRFGLVFSTERARLVGYYVSEGNVNFDKKGYPEAVTWSLGSHETEIIREIKDLCVREFGKEPSEYNYPDRPSGTSLRLWNREFATWVSDNCGTGSHTKKFSSGVFQADDELVKHIIGTWLNGDGNRDHDEAEGQFDGTTVSADMAHQFYLMMVRVGLTPSKRKITVYGFGDSKTPIGEGWRIFLPPLSANSIVAYTKWDSSDKEFRHRKYNHIGNLLLPVRKITHRMFSGLIWNFQTKGEKYEDRTFLVYGMATHNTDAYIGRALELLSDLPMSKLTLNMPKAGGKLTKKLSEEILAFCTYQLETINAFEMCQSTLWELNMIGNVYWFLEWDDEKKMWSRAVMLPPEEVYIFQYPFSENKRVEYRPQRLISLIKSQGEGETASETPKGDYDRSAMNEKIVEGVPKEMKEMVLKEGCIVMDTDPMTGSFVHHIARRRSPYMDLGASVLERVLVPMLQKEHYRYTQLSLASRNMTPKNLITAPGLMPDELDNLRTQVDLSYMDPEYSVITNYEVTWQQIGVQERMLDYSREYEQIENQVFAALGVTRELLTGEGAFSGTKITVEILNTMFLLTREVMRNFIEKQIFIPVCEAHGWFEEDQNGARKYWYPSIGFNRLTIRDNAEVFDSLFQLYSKGSLPIEVIYELFNLNVDEMHSKLLSGLFTANDSTFNRMTEEVNTEVGRAVVQQTDVVEKVSKYLGLKFRGPPQEGGGEGGGDELQQGEETPQTDGGVAPEGEGGGQEADQGQDQGVETEGSQPDPEAVAKEVADSLPPDASPQDIDEALQAVADEAGG
jgi:hypothetical protein